MLYPLDYCWLAEFGCHCERSRGILPHQGFPCKSCASLIICWLVFGCGVSCWIVVHISLVWLLSYILQHKWGNDLLASVWNRGIGVCFLNNEVWFYGNIWWYYMGQHRWNFVLVSCHLLGGIGLVKNSQSILLLNLLFFLLTFNNNMVLTFLSEQSKPLYLKGWKHPLSHLLDGLVKIEDQ